MHILRLKKLDKINLWKSPYDKEFPESSLLCDFLEDFGDTSGIEWCKEFFSNPHKRSTGGNATALDKLENNKVAISEEVPTTPDYQLILDADVLLKVMKLFNVAANTCPKEIIITFDENLQNPVVESIY
jgi:hypothetical protein